MSVVGDRITITVDGIPLEASPGQMLMEVADDAGIYIPRFCYHSKLSVAANCRMCLVEVAKSPKPLPACATPVVDGMIVNTTSEYARNAQKNVMELLLINHPLDCPICDQGGECELQDIAMGYGRDSSSFVERKRVVKDKDIGSLISTELTRCIHCTRCVRFGEEIAGLRELGMTGRGMHSLIGTYIEKTVDHEMSGNVIDLCPVGALTAKPSRFGARAWEVRQTESVAPHDAVGSNLYVHTIRDKVQRVVPRDNEAINEVWISDRDRFSYEGVTHADRIAAPMIKKDGGWQAVDWQVALNVAISGMKTVVDSRGGDALGAWVSPQATLEEMYLLQGIVRHLGSNNIDHRLMQSDFRRQGCEPIIPSIGLPIADIEKQEAILIIGANIRKEQPIIGHRIRKAALAGAQISSLNPRDFDLRFEQLEKLIIHPARMVMDLAAVAAAAGASATSVQDIISGAAPSGTHEAIADSLKNTGNSIIVAGQIAAQHIDAVILSELVRSIASATSSSVVELPAAANGVGAWQAGVIPHRGVGGTAVTAVGKNFSEMLDNPVSALIIHNVEPEHDCADPQKALMAVKASDFTVVLSPYVSGHIKDYADVILPIAPYTETGGTYVNMEGLAQSFSAAVQSHAESSPAWKVYRIMGQQLGIDGYDYETVTEILADVLQPGRSDITLGEVTGKLQPIMRPDGLSRTGEVCIYATDSLVRRADSLQQTADGKARRVVRVNAVTANKLGIFDAPQVLVLQGERFASLPLSIEEGLADDAVWLPLIPELGGFNQRVQVKAAQSDE